MLDGLSITNATAEGVKFLSASANNVLTNVSSCGNTGVGLLMRDGFYFSIVGGSYAHNRSDGIAFENTDNGLVRGAAIHGNRYNGIRGGTSNSSTYESDNITVDRCAIFLNGISLSSSFKNTGNNASQSSGIALQHNSKSTGWIITNCVLYANTQSGLYVWETCSGTLFDTIIANNGTVGLNLANHSSVTVVANRISFWGNGVPYTTTTRLTLNSPYAFPPGFTDGNRGDFRLYADSACQDLGANGTDLGLYPEGPAVALPSVETYYVRTDGSDLNTGLSNDAGGAFLTPGKAASVATPGDTIRIQPGLYGSFTCTASGTATNPVVFVADGAVTVAGGTAALTLDRAAWHVFSGLCLSNATYGIKLDFASDTLVTNCIVAKNASYGIYANESGGLTMVDSASLRNGSHGVLFVGKGASRLERCAFSFNTGSGVYAGANLTLGRRIANYVTLYRCTLFANVAHGISLEGDSYCSNWTVEHDVINNNGGSGMTAGHWCSGHVLKNSILGFNGGYGVGPSGTGASITCTYNDVFANALGNYSGFTAGTGSLSVDPLLVNPGGGDFHLFAGSSCIDAAQSARDMGVWPDAAATAVPAATTYYVRTDGNDANTGLANTPAGAFLTVQKAADTVGANGTVRIQPGFFDENVVVTLTAPATLPATFVADGQVSVTNAGHAFLLDAAAGIVLDGLTVRGGTGSDGIRLSNARACVLTNLTAAGSGAYGIYLLNSPGTVVAHCTVTNNTSDGLYLYNANGTLAYDNLFAYNKSSGVRVGINNSSAGSDNVILRRCRVIRNSSDGIFVRRDSYSDNWIIDGCTIYGNYGSGIYKDAYNSGMKLTNSIVVANHGYDIVPSAEYGTGVTIGRNDLYASRTRWPAADKHFIDIGGNIRTDPGFVAPWADDFRLYEGAPAAGAGGGGCDLGYLPGGPRVALPSAATYYVRLDGNDGNDGLANTPEGAFLTIQQAVDTAGVGDTIRIQSGVYNEAVVIAHGGAGDVWLTLVADGAVSITNGPLPALTVLGAHRVRFQGLCVTSGTGNGVVLNESVGCRFESCTLADSKLAGAHLYRSHDIQFAGCTITGNQTDGVRVYVSGQPAFERCRITGNTGSGINVGSYGGPTYLGGDFGLVRNSLVWSNTARGLDTERDSTVRYWTIESSVFHANAHGIYMDYSCGLGVIARNCIVTASTVAGIYRGGDAFTVMNCDVFGNTANYSGTFTPVNSISTDPLFRNAAAGNFKIPSASPCVDVGTNQLWMARGQATATDFDGNPRIANKLVDIGAYETATTASILIVR